MSARNGRVSGYTLEYDTARKIAQGLGVSLESLNRPGGIVEIRGDTARLLPVRERERVLLGDGGADVRTRARHRTGQLSLLEIHAESDSRAEMRGGGAANFSPGVTVLDRLHQAMLLFAHGRSDDLRWLLVEEGAGRAGGFWRLAQALSALYPRHSDEKRWVDGVLASRRVLQL